MKKYFWGILLCLIMLCGCGSDSQIYEPMQVMYKKNANESRGSYAIDYNDKIYYFSNEYGVCGLYSMNHDGTDVNMILECSDIRGLQIFNDKIYVLLQIANSKRRQFEVYEYDMNGNFQRELADDKIIRFSSNDSQDISGFFIDNDENIFLNISNFNDSRQIISKTMFYQKEEIQSFAETAVRIGEGKEEHVNANFFIYKIGENYFISKSSNHSKSLGNESSLNSKGTEDTYGYNVRYDSCLWNCDEYGNKWNNIFKIWGINENNLIISVENILFFYDIESKCIANSVDIPDKGKIIFVQETESNMYVLLENNTPSYYDNTNDSSIQVLYSLDLSSLEIKRIKDYNTAGKMIYVDENVLIDYDGNDLNLFEIDRENITGKVWSYPLETEIKSTGYQVDVANEWIFIKYYDKKNNTNSLVKKINYSLSQ